jgi:hypothetical protein
MWRTVRSSESPPPLRRETMPRDPRFHDAAAHPVVIVVFWIIVLTLGWILGHAL